MIMRPLWIFFIILANISVGLLKEITSKQSVYYFKFRKGSSPFYPSDFLAFLLLLTMIIIASITIELPDMQNYYWLYRGDLANVEAGFIFLMRLASEYGLTLETFRTIIFIISFFLLWISLERLKLNKNLSLGLYSMFAYNLDVIQMRNLLASTIVLFSLTFLILENKYGVLKYCFGLILASSIHSISAVYFILLFSVKKLLKYRLGKQVMVCLFLMTTMTALFLRTIGAMHLVLGKFFMMVNSSKADFYLSEDVRLGFITFWIMHLVFLGSAYFARKTYQLNSKEQEYRFDVIDKLFWINLVISFLLPLCILNINFYRIFRNLLPFNYAILSMVLGFRNSSAKLLTIIIFISGWLFILWYHLPIQPETLIYPFLGIDP